MAEETIQPKKYLWNLPQLGESQDMYSKEILSMAYRYYIYTAVFLKPKMVRQSVYADVYNAFQ